MKGNMTVVNEATNAMEETGVVEGIRTDGKHSDLSTTCLSDKTRETLIVTVC